MTLRGKVVLVTGGARRVGAAIARRLAACGCTIAVHCRESQHEGAALAAEIGGSLHLADLASPEQTDRLAREVLQRHGRLDVLINNASTFDEMSLDAFDLAAWDRTMRVNLTAPVQLVHALRDALRSARGRVVNLCDAATARPWPTHLAYAASKAALEAMTRALARALAPDVNVVGVAPGVAAWPDSYDAETRARLTRRIPLAREGSPDDIAAAVEFLLAGGDYITGTILTVDGGRHVV